MGEIVDGGVGVDNRTSPRFAAIEKAQEELRQVYDVREERRRELEFLERGGNPLDFKFGPAASVSVQSTSLADQPAEPEAKGSFALVTSPHGVSAESNGQPGSSLGGEPNSADNSIFYGESSGVHRRKRKNNTVLSEHSSHPDGNQNTKESEDSTIFCGRVKSQAYARRNRCKSSNESAHVGSTDIVTSICVNTSSISPSSHPNVRHLEGPILESQVGDLTVSPICNSKPASLYGHNISKTLDFDNQLNIKLDAVEAHEASADVIRVEVPDISTPKVVKDNDYNDQNSQVAFEQGHDGTISVSSNLVVNGKETVSSSLAFVPCVTINNTENTSELGGVNGLSMTHKDVNNLQNGDAINGKCVMDTVPGILIANDLETEPSNASASCGVDRNAASDHCLMSKNGNCSSDGDSKVQIERCEGSLKPNANGAKEANESGMANVLPTGSDSPRSFLQNLNNSATLVKAEEGLGNSGTDIQSEARPLTNIEDVKSNGELAEKAVKKLDNSLVDSFRSHNKALQRQDRISSNLVSPNHEPSDTSLPRRVSMSTSEVQTTPRNHLKFANKAREDAILKEARIIEGKLKRVGELSASSFPVEKRKKSHWDFVLEEMAWLSNDFMQERLWKTTAAAQICHWIASTGKLKFEKENLCRKQRTIARILAKALMNFWHSAEVLQRSGKSTTGTHNESYLSDLGQADGREDQDHKHLVEENSGRPLQLPVYEYAFRFLKFNSSSDHPVLAEAPTTPDRIADTGILVIACEYQFLEEKLFYTVPVCAMQAYRESVQSDWVHYDKKMGSTIHQVDYEASMHDSVAEFQPEENTFEEDEDETSMYYLPGAFDSSKSLKFVPTKRKKLQPKSFFTRAYEVGGDYGSSLESKLGTHPSLFTGKRPSNNLNVCSVPTKRVRTAARQRVVSPFSAGTTGAMQVTSRNGVSSGDTDSFQDDQSSLQGGFLPRKNLEVESTVEFEQHIPFDGPELPAKSKKKKKPKHLGYKNSLNSADSGGFIMSGKASSYEQNWQVNSTIQQDQRDPSKRRLESHYLESNGNTGIYGQHAAKKPKLLKQFLETSSKAITPLSGSILSPIASQISDMSSPHKLIKMIANRDRGKKSKVLKMASVQSGYGNPWSLFEDQALVVLVHDMGPNWELVSDAINSTLRFKQIFRKPKDCKERHSVLIDRNSGDGADSAEDSGSSQPYPSTLPGIPKGSARQLLQRLQGPIEEDTLKSHFEKIILIGQHLPSHRSQNDCKDLKEIIPVHRSHDLAFSQACSSNLTRGPLTPLELCDAIASSPDVLALGYQGPHSNGFGIPSHQVSAAPVLPTSAANSMLQGSPGMVMGNGLPSPSTALNSLSRDALRYGVPRPTSLPVDDQKRLQQYSQMYPGKNIQQSGMSVSGALPIGTDHSVHILPGGGGIGVMCGMNRGMPMPRPGFQGIGSSGMLNMVSPGSMLSSSGVGMPSPLNIHPSAISGPGNSMSRPRDALQMLRPGQSPEDHRQMLMQELQLQVTQGNGQAIAPISGMSAPFSNQTVPSPAIQSFPVHQQQPQPHQMPQQPHMLGNHHHPHIQGTNHSSPQQQAYSVRLAKERNQHKVQQRLLQQQQQFPGSRVLSPLHNSSQIQQQPQSSSSSSMMPVCSQTQHNQGSMARNPQAGSGLPSQMIKQRQRPQLPQQQQQQQQELPQQPPPPQSQPKHQQQQRKQSQKQTKLMKSVTRGNIMMHQNMAVDASHVSGLSSDPGCQDSEKHLMQQVPGLFPGGSGSNSTLPRPSNQQKMHSHPLSQPLKQMPHISSHPDTCSQSQVQVPLNHTLLASQQPSSSQRHPQQQLQRQTTQSHQTMQRMMLHQNRQMSIDNHIHPPDDQVQVNQLMTTTPITQSTDSGSAVPIVTPAPLSACQWNSDLSYDTTTPAPTSHLANSLQPNLVGTEQVMPPPSQGLPQRQFLGSQSTQGHGIGGQWQQQQQPPPQQQQLPPPSHQP